MDKYLVEINKCITEIENLCGLNLLSSDNVKIGQKSIDEILTFSQQQSTTLPKESLKALNTSVSKKIVLLAYTNARMNFYNKKKIEFAQIPYLTEIAKVLIAFTKKETITNNALVNLDKCVIILNNIDAKDSNMKQQLGYRCIRLFIVLVSYGFLCSAGILADLILSQLIISE